MYKICALVDNLGMPKWQQLDLRNDESQHSPRVCIPRQIYRIGLQIREISTTRLLALITEDYYTKYIYAAIY